MDYFALIVPAIFILVLGRFLHGRIKHGSWTGSFLGGRIEKTLGEVPLTKVFGTSQKIKVHAMRPADHGEAFVALVVTAKAPMSASMVPYKLTRAQALELADYLRRATQDGVA
jgi:hypothetical protein